MSILQIIAILGFCLGSLSFIVELRSKNPHSKVVFILLIVMSIALLGVCHKAKITSVTKLPSPTQATAQDSNEIAAAPDDENVDFDLSDLEIPEEPPETTPNQDGEAAPNQEAPKQEPSANESLDNAKNDAVVPKPTQETPPAEPAPEIVPDDPLAPTAIAGAPIDDGKVNEVITFSAKKSKPNANGTKLESYLWDFGDGTKAEGIQAKHAYEKPGIYQATLTVLDADNHFGIAVRQIEINRPESKIKFINRDLSESKNITSSLEPYVANGAKQFTGSTILFEVSAFIQSTDASTCELSVAIQGPECSTTKSKTIAKGGEGTTSVKASCKGELGDYTFTLQRKVSGSGTCSFSDVKIEASEY